MGYTLNPNNMLKNTFYSLNNCRVQVVEGCESLFPTIDRLTRDFILADPSNEEA